MEASPDLIEHLLEIRGLGIINVMTLFGAGLFAAINELPWSLTSKFGIPPSNMTA